MATIVALGAPGTVDAGLNIWTTGGPEGGSVVALVADPKIRGVLYAATFSGNVFKSATGGGSWAPINAGLPLGPFPVFALAIDPQTPTTLYAGTLGRGVFKSTNGGASWSERNGGAVHTDTSVIISDQFILSLAVDPQTPTTLYAIGFRGPSTDVFKSTNGGASWENPIPGLPSNASVGTLVIDPQTPTTLYAGGGGLVKSTDGGVSWAGPHPGVPQAVLALAIDPRTPTTIYAGTNQGDVLKSTNGGGTWSPNNLGLPGRAVRALALDPQTPATLYAGTAGGGVFKTTSGGAVWSPVNAGLTSRDVTVLTVDPQAPATLYAGTFGGGAFKSTSGGASWGASNSGLTGQGILALALDPQTPATLYAGTNEGSVFKSTTGGASWSPRNEGLPGQSVLALAVDPQAPATVYAATLGGGLFKSTAGGAGWNASSAGLPPEPTRVLAIDPQSPATLYAGTDASGVFKSTNGGASWSPSNAGLASQSITALAVDGRSSGTTGTVFDPDNDAFPSPNSNPDPDLVSATVSSDGTNLLLQVRFKPGTFDSQLTQVTLSLDTDRNPATGHPGSDSGCVNDNGIIGAEFVVVLGANLGATAQVFRYLGTCNSFAFGGTGTTTFVADGLNGTVPLSVLGGTDGRVHFKIAISEQVGPNAFTGGLDHMPNIGLAAGQTVMGAFSAILYAGTGNGVFKTTNGGASWSPSNAGLTSTSVTALVVDPRTPATLYAGTSSGGVFKSTNGGASWSPRNDGLVGNFVLPILALAIDPQTPATLYASTLVNGVFKSTNGGASWSPSNTGLGTRLKDLDIIRPLVVSPSGACLHAGSNGGVFDFATQVSVECPAPPILAARLLTTDQPVGVGTAAQTFVTVQNLSGGSDASDAGAASVPVAGQTCGITQLTGAPTPFTFQAVGAMDGQPIAPMNTPVDIAPGSTQGFVMTLTPQASLCALEIQFGFNCTNTGLADTLIGVNTLLLSATPTAPCGVTASVSVSQPSFAVGQTLVAGGSLQTSGLPGTFADVYVGNIRPDLSIQFMTGTGIVVGHVADLRTFRPLGVNVPLGTPFSVRQPAVFAHSWTAADPRGPYVFFLAVVKVGALAGGTIAGDQILGLATAPYSLP